MLSRLVNKKLQFKHIFKSPFGNYDNVANKLLFTTGILSDWIITNAKSRVSGSRSLSVQSLEAVNGSYSANISQWLIYVYFYPLQSLLLQSWPFGILSFHNLYPQTRGVEAGV